MKIHDLKIEEQYYIDVCSGKKTFELRKNDRDYQVGDYVIFNVIKEGGIYQTQDIYKITYVLKDVEKYGLNKEYCIFSLKKMLEEK